VNPLVNWLELMKVPRVAGTVIVMASIIGAPIFGTYSPRGQMQTIVAQLPEAAATFATGLARMRIGEIGNLRTMRNAATEVERATTQETAVEKKNCPTHSQPFALLPGCGFSRS
jgi:hypothetical protein